MLKRKVLSLVLALALIVSMAIPALAGTESGSGNLANYDYEFYAYCDSVSSSGEMRYLGATQLTSSITNYCWCNMHGDMLTTSGYNTGRGNVIAYAGRYVGEENGVAYHDCTVSYAIFTGKVGTNPVAPGITVRAN